MRVIASVATTSDGYMDDCRPERLVISGEEDWREVYRLRAECDAIMVGAETLRRDNPALVMRDEGLRKSRTERGLPPDIIKVTVSGGGNIDPALRFFTEGPAAEKLVLLGPEANREAIEKLSGLARVISLDTVSARSIREALAKEGIEKVMLEGGSRMIGMFMDEGCIDEFRLAVGDFALADVDPTPGCADRAPQLPHFGNLPFAGTAEKRTTQVGNMLVTHYVINREPTGEEGKLTDKDKKLLKRAIEISRRSAPCATAYRVGCVLMTPDGSVFEGYTHETGNANHAEEEAIAKAEQAGADIKGATIYTSMEPCSTRASKPVSCSELIIRGGISRVIYAYSEPDCFVRCDGDRMLREAGVEVIKAAGFAEEVIEINAHIIANRPGR